MAFAHDIIRTGSLFITVIDNRRTRQRLVVKNGGLVLDTGRTFFNFDQGFLKLANEEKFLAVDEMGNLVLKNQPQIGFNLTTERNKHKVKRTISYKGDSKFELCTNNSIRYKSGCPESKTILLNYVDLITPV